MEDLITKLDAIKVFFPVMILIGVVVYAIVERIKAEAPSLKSFWYTFISMGVGAGLFAIFVYAPVIVLGFLFVGLLASGIFDITKYVGKKQ
jgi:Fe2+ transport system protein B